MMPRVEISTAALSYWGRMMTELRGWGWTFRAVSRESLVRQAALHQMTVDPNYEPSYRNGLRFRRFYLRVARLERGRSANRTRNAG